MSTTNTTGFFNKLAKAFKRRLPHMRSYLVFTGSPDITRAGSLKAKGMEMVEITPENADLALEFRKPEVVQKLHKYLARGFRGWFAVFGDIITGYAFIAVVKDGPEVVRGLLLYPKEAGVILVYSRPEYRILGSGIALGREISALAAQEGFERLVMWTVPSHGRMRHIMSGDGFTDTSKVWILEFWGRPVLRFTRGSSIKR